MLEPRALIARQICDAKDGPEIVAGLLADNERLRELVCELTDDLEAEVEGRYRSLKDHPAMHRRYERDMATVYKARAALEGKG